MSSNDIVAPVLPESAKKKEGFLHRLFSSKEDKEKDDLEEIRNSLGISGKKKSIQEAFEEHVEENNGEVDSHIDWSLDTAPKPPKETLSLEEDEQELALLPSKEETILPKSIEYEEENPFANIVGEEPILSSDEQEPALYAQSHELSSEAEDEETFPNFEEEEKPLEDHFSLIKEEVQSKFPIIKLYLPGKKAVITLHDLRDYVAHIKPSEYEKKAAQIPDWIRQRPFRKDLADEMRRATTKKDALAILDHNIGKMFVPDHYKSKKHEKIEIHFDKITDKHKKSMQELEDVVRAESLKQMPKPKTKHLKKHKDMLASLEDLLLALDMMSEKEYTHLLSKGKNDLRKKIRKLSIDAAHIKRLDPKKLKSQVERLLKEHRKEIAQLIEKSRNELNVQADLLLDQEKLLEDERARLDEQKEYILQQQQRLDEQSKLSDEELGRFEDELSEYQKRSDAFLKEYEKKITSFKKKSEQLDKKLTHKKNSLESAWHKKMTKLQKKETLLHDKEDVLSEKEKDLETREKALQQKMNDFEKEMQDRESLVQNSVEKIIAIDEDIKAQKDELDEMKKEVENAGFKKYLESQLKNPTVLDVVEHHSPEESESMRQHNPQMYMLIEQCEKAIESKHLDKAKEHYDELKRLFDKDEIDASEKEVIYDALKELYTNLHLALLDR